MASPLLLRDGENVSGDMLQRILGSQFAGFPAISGIGTGFAAGGVGVMNKAWTGAALPTGHMVVSATGTTMVLTISAGWAVVIRDQGTSSFDPRAVLAELQASTTVTVSANSTGSTRNDTVCLKVDLNTAPSADGSNLVSAVILAGASGGALPNAPADGNLYLPLANIAVANGATSIAQANVTDKRRSGVSDYIPFGGRAHANAAQSVPNATTSKLLIGGTIDNDPNGNFDVANNRWWCPTPGRYAAIGQVHFSGAAVAGVFVEIFKNGASVSRGAEGTAFGSVVTDQLVLAAGDYLEAWATQSSGGAVNTVAGANVNFLAVNFLGP